MKGSFILFFRKHSFLFRFSAIVFGVTLLIASRPVKAETIQQETQMEEMQGTGTGSTGQPSADANEESEDLEGADSEGTSSENTSQENGLVIKIFSEDVLPVVGSGEGILSGETLAEENLSGASLLLEDAGLVKTEPLQTETKTLQATKGFVEDKVQVGQEEPLKKKETKQKKKAGAAKEKQEYQPLAEKLRGGRSLSMEKATKLSDAELNALQRIVEAEAGNEDIMGRILVANVVLNRYHSEVFPNTIDGVVTQTSYGSRGLVYQFTPAKPSGRYWYASPSAETKEAVKRALAGEDYSQGALYFAARKYANQNHMSWFDRKLTRLFQHGNHEFYK